ncbi:hypothetical protein EK904_001887 [Melospiza melodia maxima]|nr:hypothetical protein EK904_001887 [Melospiza melodia maxima]
MVLNPERAPTPAEMSRDPCPDLQLNVQHWFVLQTPRHFAEIRPAKILTFSCLDPKMSLTPPVATSILLHRQSDLVRN